ncbi:MAG TPA: DUF308 domain-containing protein [Candidatus Dietzia merdigallinarum]|nr:DUF308 domain-containing protein [Candidatus Dietzia merdigallinarum]
MTTSTFTPVAKGMRAALIIGGLIAVAFGIAVLVWPGKTAVVVTGVIAVWAIIAGLIYIGMSFASTSQSTGSRVGHGLLGLLYVVAGIYAFASLQQSAAFLGIFVTVLIGVMWIFEGFTALFSLGEASSKGLTIFFAIISVLAGISLVSTPLWGAGFLWWLAGIALLVLGILNVVRGFSIKA